MIDKIKIVIGAAILCSSVLFLFGCGESPASPDVSPSPVASPTPEPPKLAVIVRVVATQGGNRAVTTVQHNDEFKISGTATACFLLSEEAPKPTECPIIPRWSQRVIGGFNADCRPQGAINGASVQWYCTQPGNPTFEACAEAFDGTTLGCDFWSMEVQ